MAQRQPDQQGLANQGQPLGGPSQHSTGTKVTTDPSSTLNPIHEPTGPIASDSLAAESTRANGAFASNRDPAPQSVSGSSSTFNNTDTSGATATLEPAPDAAERKAKEAWREVPDEARGVAGQKYPEGAGGVEFPGVHSEHGYAGGSRAAAQQEAGAAGAGSGYTASGMRGGAAPAAGTSAAGEDNSSSSTSNAEAAPGYVSSVMSDPAARTGKPHGKNITEGGFEPDDAKNASFTSEIGSKDDPGRAAEEQFQTKAVGSAGAKGPRQEGVTGDGQYDALETDQGI
ncbi:MAG: hypothetical protein Q9197_003147 [Variospora fuerteventurae]